MADSKDLQSQLELNNAINNAIKQRAGLLKQQGQSLTTQVQIAMELCKALKCEDLDGMTDRLQEMQGALEDAAGTAEEFSDNMGKGMDQASKKAEGTSKGFRKMGGGIKKTHAAGLGMFKGFAQGFAGGLMDIRAVISGFAAIAKGAFRVAKAIIAIPFQLLGALVDAANDGAGGGAELRQAYEDAKETLGDLAYGEGAAAVELFKGMREQAGNLAGTGLSLAQVFGRGQGGLAAALGDAVKILSTAGPITAEAFKTMGKEAKVKSAMVTKALGISEEGMESFAAAARKSGKTLDRYLVDMSKKVLRSAKQFGISAKFITKDLQDMSKDFVTFGNMAEEEMIQTSVYARKLGTDIEGLKSIMDKFSDFESTQNAVAELNQTLGIQLDTMKLLRAENPAQTIDQMREAFFGAGKSLEDMNRHQRAAIKDLYGMDDAMLKAALSAENAGLSMEEIKAASEGNQEAQMSEKEVMLELAKSIKKMVETGGDGFQGFFDAFAKGFRKGAIEGSRFREVFRNIRKSLRVFYRFGKEVGKIMGKLLKDLGLTKAMKKLFNPKDFMKLFGLPGGKTGLLGIFRKFKDSITGKGDYSPQQMFEDVKKEFSKFFGGKNKALKILQGFGEAIIKILGKAIGKAVEFMGIAAANGINFLISIITGKRKLVSDSVKTGLGGAFQDAMSSIGDGLVKAWEVLGPALGELFRILWAKAKPVLIEFGKKAFGYIMIKAIVLGLAQAAASTVVFGAFKALAVKMGLMAATTSGPVIAGNAGFGAAIASIQGVIGTLGAGAGATMALIKSAAANGLAIGVFITTVMLPLAGLFGLVAVTIGQLGAEAIVKTFGVFVAMVLSLNKVAMIMTKMAFISAKLPAIQTAAFAMGKILLAMSALAITMTYAMGLAADVAPKDAIVFFATITAILLSSAATAKIAIMMKPLFPMLKPAALGLTLIGVFALAAGGLGAVLVSMLSGFSPGLLVASGVFFAGFGLFLGIIGALVPLAAGVGAVVLKSFGIGAALIIAGLTALVAFGGFVIAQVIPLIDQLAKIDIGDPGAFKQKMEGLLALLKAIGSIVGGVANMVASLGPRMSGIGSGKQTSITEGITAVSEFLDKLMGPEGNIQHLINQITEFAQIAEGFSPQALKAVGVLTGVLQGVAALVKAMAPSDEAVKAAAKVEEEAWVAGAHDVLGAASDFANKMLPVMKAAFEEMKGLMTFLKDNLAGMDFSKVGPLLKPLPGMLQGAGEMMKALQPDGKAWDAVAEAADTWGEDSVKTINAIRKMVASIARMMGPVMRSMTSMMQGVISALHPLIKTVAQSKADPKAISATAKVIGAIMKGVGILMKQIGVGMKRIMEYNAKDQQANKVDPTGLEAIKKVIDLYTGAFTQVIPKMGDLIKGLMKVTQRLPIVNPKIISMKLKVLTSVFGVFKDLMEVFAGPFGLFSSFTQSKGKNASPIDENNNPMSNLQVMVHNIDMTIKSLLTPMGKSKKSVVETLVEAMAQVNPKYGTLGKLIRVSKVFKAVSSALVVLKELGEMFGKGKVGDAFHNFIYKNDKLNTVRINNKAASGPEIMVHNIKSMIDLLLSPRPGMKGSIIDSLIGSMARIDADAKKMFKLQRVAKIMTHVGTALETLKTIGTMFGPGTPFASRGGVKVDQFNRESFPIDRTYDSIAWVIAMMFGKDMKMSSGGTAKGHMPEKNGVIGALVSAMTGVGFKYGDVGKLINVKNVMKAAGEAIVALDGAYVHINAAMKRIKTAPGAMMSVDPADTVSGKIKAQTDYIKETADAVNRAYGKGGLGKSVRLMTKGRVKVLSNGGRALVDMVKAINDVNVMLNKLEPIDVTMAANKFAAVMGVNQDKVTVKRGEVRVNINLKVNIEGKRLAKALIDQRITGKGNQLAKAE